MRNLAGVTTAHANAYIEDELTEACIPISKGKPSNGEVPASLTGVCQGFTFRRAWCYWEVTGVVPLSVAHAMYHDPRGHEDVRVEGNCTCPEPRKDVYLYHIDSQDGLNLFAEKVLGTRPLPPTEDAKEAALWIARSNQYGRVIYEDGLTEEDYLAAQEEVHEIRRALTDLRHRLDDLSRGTDQGMIPTDSIAHTVACSLTTAIVTLYELENPADDRSFAARLIFSPATPSAGFSVGNRVKITNTALTLWGEFGWIVGFAPGEEHVSNVRLDAGPTIRVPTACLTFISGL